MARRPADESRGEGPAMSAQSARSAPPSRRAQLSERRSEIIKVFAELGLVDLLTWAGLMRYAPVTLKARQAAEAAPEETDRPERLRLALEKLGGAFIKIGQLLSVRPDLIPPEYAAELEKLQEGVPPMPFATVKQIVESELECDLSDAYKTFSESPLGSASISQVHAAELHDGTKVVVKVQRPEIPTLIDLDLELMTRAARALAGTPWGEDFDPVGAAAEFAQAVRSELDFTAEARNLDSFGEFFADDDTVVIPATDWDHTTGRLLTESRLDGITLSRPDDIRDTGGDVQALVRNGVNAYLRMVFDLRKFHSDPHPGNLLAMPDDAVGFLDFGRVSHAIRACAGPVRRVPHGPGAKRRDHLHRRDAPDDLRRSRRGSRRAAAREPGHHGPVRRCRRRAHVGAGGPLRGARRPAQAPPAPSVRVRDALRDVRRPRGCRPEPRSRDEAAGRHGALHQACGADEVHTRTHRRRPLGEAKQYMDLLRAFPTRSLAS